MKFTIPVEHVERHVAEFSVEADDLEAAKKLALEEAKFTFAAVGGVWSEDENYFSVVDD